MNAARRKRDLQAVGYVRVSTEGQATDGVSLAAQREKIVGYCDLHGLELVITFSDEGISGKRADNRPGLDRAIKRACKLKGVLVVYSLSRLARSTLDCIAIVDRLEKCGADLASITEKIDTTSGMGRFFFRLMASLGELERDQISERTKAGLDYKRKRGEILGSAIPFGYDLADDGVKLLPNANEQTVIKRMIALREGEGMSYQRIADTFNDEDVPAKGGGIWYANGIMTIYKRSTRNE